MKVGIVIPAYNVGDQLSDVLCKALTYVPSCNIYVVDDGSTDSTAEVAICHGVVLHQHRTNMGKGEALRSGFGLALVDDLDGIITMDGDGQHDPDYIPDFIATMEETACDLVLGIRSFRIGKMPLDRIFSNLMSSWVVSIVVREKIHDSQCGYRLFRAGVLDGISLSSSHYEVETELLIKAIWKGCKIAYCPILLTYEDYRSHIRRFVDTKRFCRMVIRLIRERQSK